LAVRTATATRFRASGGNTAVRIGSVINNSDGATSFYDKSGRFTGSSSNTTQPK